MSEWRIPLSSLAFDYEEQTAALRVLESGWLSMGPEVAAFENEFAELSGVTNAFAVSSGTAALHLALLALNLQPGDEVIQPAINFVAAANMTLAVGATPVFADICSLAEPNIDPEQIKRLISEKTKAVIVMHYGGYFCRMDEIQEICKANDLSLIEDACHAVGARYEGSVNPRMAGAIGDIGCFSFFSNKNLATGEGGMLITASERYAELVRKLRSHGMTSLTWDRHKGHASSYDVVAHGYNYRLDELHAALGRVQLKKLSTINEQRRRLSVAYHQHLQALKGWILPFSEYTGGTSSHLLVAVAPDTETRDRTVADLKAARIQTSMHYPLVTSFSAFRDMGPTPHDPRGLVNSRAFAERALTLPLFSSMRVTEVEAVSSVMFKQELELTAGGRNANLDAGAR